MEVKAVTRVAVTTRTFRWRIEGFRALCDKTLDTHPDCNVESPKFSIGPYTFSVQLAPAGGRSKHKEWISLYLNLRAAAGGRSSVLCRLRFRIESGTALLADQGIAPGTLSLEVPLYGYEKVALRKDVVRAGDANGDVVTVSTEVGVVGMIEHDSVPNVPAEEPLKELLRDLKGILQSGAAR